MFDGWKVVEDSAMMMGEGGMADCVSGLQNGVLGWMDV